MDIDLSKYFDTPERERSYALLTRRPHLETGLYFGLFLLGGFPQSFSLSAQSNLKIVQNRVKAITKRIRASTLFRFNHPVEIADAPFQVPRHTDRAAFLQLRDRA